MRRIPLHVPVNTAIMTEGRQNGLSKMKLVSLADGRVGIVVEPFKAERRDSEDAQLVSGGVLVEVVSDDS